LNDIKIQLKEVNPQDFFGDQNVYINKLKSYFPKLKIIARGDTITAYGELIVLEEFKSCTEKLICFFLKHNRIDSQSIENIVLTDKKNHTDFNDHLDSFIIHGVGGKVVKAKTFNQIEVVKSVKNNDLVFAIGPAGTGKTYTAVAIAVKALKDKLVKRIILTRPAVEAGENLGFLPGDLKEKLDPYMQPLYDALQDMVPNEKLKSYLEKGIIQIAPLAFMRGRTLDNAFVVLDEAQNTTHSQMKMFLTRMGQNAKFILTGDPGQIDLPSRTPSGLKEAILVLSNIKGISIIHLDETDIIRHSLLKKVLNAYKKIEHEN
jgi:phosphate starvation-inducible PhoH-like protein